MKKQIFALFGLLNVVCVAFAEEGNRHKFSYDVFSNGKDIGDVRVYMEDIQNGGFHIIEQTEIQTDGLWKKSSISSMKTEQFSRDGDFIHSDSKVFDGRSAHWLWVDAKNQNTDVFYAEVNKLSEDELTGLGNVFSSVSLSASQLMLQSQSLFKKRIINFQGTRYPQKSFDTTLANFPRYSSGQQGDTLRVIRILDTENLAINTYNIEMVGLKKLVVHSKKIDCEVYVLQSDEKEVLELWIARNEKDMPHFVQIKGQEKGDAYQIILKP
ncbi:hypothetical protein [Teredinibacter sp. KSP-S5-2]|uniref:hypothetical protein n=1 Tax=Teredinibacter sp. KSP-S5-2 TaxID=3034506 RepID=UPI002935313A|nr:hypothetical protein [Teredinibacter sp. KSP-S5-2]WNO09030.1 hypothetical protein P5V12_18975 [Teredinibacter sp. KSP-S5-2]